MKKRLIMSMICSLLFLLPLAGYSRGTGNAEWHTPPDRWAEPRIHHSPFDQEYEQRIRISHISRRDGSALRKVFSSNKAYWYSAQPPDYLKKGPWSTDILLDNERSYLIDIRLVDHSQYDLKVNWINEKLLYIQVWWGRILGSYLIFDLEKERIVSREMVHDGSLPFQQFKQMRKTDSH